ncbi:hypothetical protein Pfo_030350 [Paulownia fortunei]|nr:hypothetical protein Pfo_030350 [Paulownia fortunei]
MFSGGGSSSTSATMSSAELLSPAFFEGLLKVNKRHLSLAFGIISLEFGVTIVTISLLMNLAMGIMFRSPSLFFALLVDYLEVYTCYTYLFMRWKRNPFLAAACIMIVKAIAVQFAYFVHIQQVMNHVFST